MAGYRGVRAVVTAVAAVLVLGGCSSDNGVLSGGGPTPPRANGDTAHPPPATGPVTALTLVPESPVSPEVLGHAADVLRRRLATARIPGGSVEVAGDRLVVSGARDRAADLEALLGPARLSFRPVLVSQAVTSPPDAPAPPARHGGPRLAAAPAPGADPAIPPETRARFDALDCPPAAPPVPVGDPAGFLVACDAGAPATSPGTREKFLLGAPALDGASVSTAVARMPRDGSAGGWEVGITFTGDGATRFHALTERLAALPAPANRLAVEVDGAVLSAPVIATALPGGEATIAGAFNRESAERLAALLGSGALPVAFRVSGPTTAGG